MKLQTPAELIRAKCKPCEGGVEPYSQAQVEAQLAQLPSWYVTHDGQRIRRDWVGRNFVQCMAFLERVAELAEDDGHHPDLHLERYRQVAIELWTHAIGGLSENDFILAAKIDQVAAQSGLT